MAVHRDRLEAMIEESTEEAARLKAELEQEWDIKPGSGKQLAEYFKLHEIEGWPRTDGGAPKTDQEAMKRLIGKYPSVEKWVRWKEIEKIRSTYDASILKKLTAEGRVHARFKAFGTATGRFSSSTPNLQNIPKRGQLGPRMHGLFWSGSDDRVLIKADYASIELWLAAIRWQDPYMQNALKENINMHVATAAGLFNVKPEEVTKQQKATGKIVNFALLYGGSPNRILEEFRKNGIPIDEVGARQMHAKFFSTYTGFQKRREDWRLAYWKTEQAKGTPTARTAIGRRRTFGDWHSPFMNHEIQGTGADSLPYPTI